ncbi:MAG: ATP-binding protein [Hyphomicrobiales bacterium]|nr:ATP-binding protein [Hyphomicrobiales bacterium]
MVQRQECEQHPNLFGKNAELGDSSDRAGRDSAGAKTTNSLEAADKLKQLGMLTGKVAHELRNPLGTINTAVYVIERRGQSDDPKIDQAIERIKTAIARSDRLISELLDFAKGNELAKDLIPVDLWLTRVLAEQAQNLPRAIKLEFNLDAGSAAIAFDAYKMQASINNLINNAAEALVGKGDDPSSYFRSDPEIRVSTRLAQRGLEISVYNNGPMIDEQDMKKILTPLFTTKSFGTGLGLSVVQDILVQHGGGLEIENGRQTGVTFTAWISSESLQMAEDCTERTGSIMCGLN